MNPGEKQSVVTKTTCRGENDRLEYAVSSMQGYRDNMEDAHATIEDLDVSTATSFFGVYDGHGGPAVSKYCARHLHAEVLNHPEFVSNLPNAVQRAFFRMDEMMKTKEGRKELTEYGANDYCKEHPGPLDEGSTALVVLIRGNQIIFGNAGDCRCVLSRNGQAFALSTDHKPSVPGESQRIQNAGRSVRLSRGASRIDDGIAASRSTGDMKYKNNIDLIPELQALTCSPEIRFGMDMAASCESNLDMCVGPPRPSFDNMTIILVQFKHAATAPANPQHNRQEHAITDDMFDKKRKVPLEVELSTSVPSRKSTDF